MVYSRAVSTTAPAGAQAGPATADAPPSRSMLRALSSHNFRLFFIGQGLSLIGTWLARVATAWLVYELVRGEGTTAADHARAAAALAAVGFAGLIPTFVLAPFAGVLVDRVSDRFRLMTITQVFALLQSGALAALTLGGWITVPHIVALSLLQGLINAFDTPARQALVVDMVDRREDLANAIALNSGMFNSARLVGPAIAGVMLSFVSAGWCFLIDTISYAGVIVALLLMHKRLHPPAIRRNPVVELALGFRFAFGFPPVRALLLLAGLTSFMTMIQQTLLPIFADTLAPASGVLSHGSRVYGLLLAATGVGALSATVALARRSTVLGLGRVIMIAAVAGGLAIAAFGMSPSLWLSLPLIGVAGFAQISVMASSNTVLQTIVDDHMRGRLMAFFTMSVMGMAPFGSLLSGWLTNIVGPNQTIMMAGFAIAIGGLLFSLKLPAMRRMVRPIYVRKGIIPEVATGLRAVTT